MENISLQSRCNRIIHTHAALAAAGNAVPVPGLGWAADTVAMTSMAMQLASVYGKNIPETVAKGMAVTAIRRTVLKKPVKALSKGLSRICPVLGAVVGPAVSASMLESAGWSLARSMETYVAS